MWRPFEGHTLGSLLQHAESAWSRVGSRPRSSGNVRTLYVFLRVLLPYQMRQDANNTLQERSMSCAYQKYRVHRHLDLRVLSTTARVPHIGSGRSALELSLDVGVASRAGQGLPCHALVALLPTCQCTHSSRPHRRSCLTNEWVRRTRIALTRVSDRRPRCAWALSASGAGSNLGEAWQRDRAGHTY